MIQTRLVVLFALFAAGATAFIRVSTVQGQAEDEQVLWNLEESYFAHLADREFEALEDFWHPDFIGWPSHSAEPVGLANAQGSLEELTARLKKLSIELRPQALTLHGDVAVVHYYIDVVQEGVDGQVTEYSQRITHTWVRSDGRWRILGGMSSQ
jgi:ketosteroid isomerase-like protein